MFAALREPECELCGQWNWADLLLRQEVAAVQEKDYLSFSRIYEHNLFLRWNLNCTADLWSHFCLSSLSL